MSDTNNALLMRAQYQSYMETTINDAGIHLIGEGFTDLTESKNANEYSRHYIHELSERSDVTGYSPSISYSADAYTGDPVCLEIMAVSDQELTGTAAQRNVYSVNTWEKGSTDNTCVAYKRTYAIIPGDKGSGTDALIYTGTLKSCGDATKIDWDTSTNQPKTT